MDPISAFGVITGAFQLVSVISETLSGLSALRGKYQYADLTIASLERELMTIQAAVTQIESCKNVSLPDSNVYNESLDGALEGCHTVMEALWEEVSSLSQGEGTRARLKIVWREDVMRAHQERLQSQVFALHLLVAAGQCQTYSDQIAMLRKRENQYLLRKIADDAATVRSSRRTISRAGTSTFSHRASTPGDTVFDFDGRVVSSLPYQRVLHQSQGGPEIWSTTSQGSRSQMTDEGYGSGIPTNTTVSRNGSLVLPGHPSGSISPTLEHSNSVFSSSSLSPNLSTHLAQRSKSDSKFPPKLDRSKTKREKLHSMMRRMSFSSLVSASPSSSSSPQLPIRSSTVGAGRRIYEKDINTSIDLTSADGASAPLIVKTAQSGSRSDVERLIENRSDLEAKHFKSGRTALLVASHCGNDAVVALLIQKNARIDAADRSGSTALHLAASRNHCGVLQLLISQRIDIEAKDSKERTSLWVAAERGQLEAARILLENKARVNARAGTQMTALHAASKQGDDAMVKLLLRANADLEAKDATMMTALHYACEKGHEGVIKLLLDNKANIDAPGSDRRTPLICAAAVGDLEATRILLTRKAPLWSADDGGMMALHWAAYNGHDEVVNLLSSKRSSLEKSNLAGRTALHLAAMNSQFAVVETLVRKTMSMEIRCQSGLTALHYACLANNIEISKLLLISGASIEAQMEGELQRRPMHIAAAKGSMGLLNLLCDKGASLDARDTLGLRALGVACRYGHAAAVQKLLDRGSPVHLPSEIWSRDDSPLCIAAMAGHLPVVMILLERGASVLKQDEHDWFPYQYAAHHGHPHVLEVLLSRTLGEFSTNGTEMNLPFEGIGFAPSANISEDRRGKVLNLLYQAQRQPQLLRRIVTFPEASTRIQEIPRTSLGGVSPGHAQDPYVSSLTPVPEMLPQAGAQELPGTLEQGLPSSRSQTPEQMHGPRDDEGPVLRPIVPNLTRAPERDTSRLEFRPGPVSYASPPLPTIWGFNEPYRDSPLQRPPLSHPVPRREGRNPESLLPAASRILGGGSGGGRSIGSPVSISGTNSDRDVPTRAENRDSWSSARLRLRERLIPDLNPDSDDESISSMHTAPEGVAELPA